MNHSNGNGKRGVLVIGAGVSGLTCALVLRRRGFEVSVVADRFAPQVTSVVAGALWEWPPAVCGHHQNLTSLARAKKWSASSYQIFADLARNPDTGVFLRRATFYFRRPVEDRPRQLDKMNELKGIVREFRHDPGLMAANGINPDMGLRDAYAHLAPMIDTDTYLAWLLGEVRQGGCRIQQRRLAGSLREHEAALKKEFHAQAIVNCAGLGARELADEPMYPLRGALVRVRNDGRAMPRITEAHCVSADESSYERAFLFVVPRGRDWLVLGGLAEPDEWDLDIGLDNYEPVRTMYERCLEFLPVLRQGQLDVAEPVRVGLRPMRKENIRLEGEAGTCIIHNYGHGGSGVTLSWGCAAEVADEVERVLSEKATSAGVSLAGTMNN
jgi:D-amino-acid oxidase